MQPKACNPGKALSQPVGMPCQSRLKHLFTLLPIGSLYLCLACFGIDSQSLWVDEVYSIRDSASVPLLWAKGQGPLHFALLHVWMKVVTSEGMFRVLSVLCGLIAVILFYVISRQLGKPRVTIFGTVLFATSPLLIWYSQEIRYITLMMATALLTIYTLQRLMIRGSFGGWLAYGSAVLLALLSFVTNIFLPLAQGLYLLGTSPRRSIFSKWFICQLLVGLLFVGWAGDKFVQRFIPRRVVTTQQTMVKAPVGLNNGSQRDFSLNAIPYTFFVLSAGLSQGPSVRELSRSQSLKTLRPYASLLTISALLFGGLFVAGLIHVWRLPDTRGWLLLWFSIPLIGVMGMSAITNATFNVRYVAMILPAYMLILTVGITYFRHSIVQVILLLAVLGSNGLSLANYYSNPHYARDDARAAIRYLKSVNHSQDTILILGDSTGGSSSALKYYAMKSSLPVTYLSNVGTHDLSLTQRLQNRVKGAHRLWYLESRPWLKDPNEEVKHTLNDMYRLIEHRQWPGIELHVYQLLP